MLALGVDGCRGGWLAVALRIKQGVVAAEVAVYAAFHDLLSVYPDADAVAVDMPIGLWESGRARLRPCDARARHRLGKRASCIFIPPTRAMLNADSYTPLRTLGLSVQAYHLIPRIRELDALMTPALQTRVWESHPELSFTAMAGAPIPYPKRTEQGQTARLDTLQRALGAEYELLRDSLDAFPKRFTPAVARADDLLDAWALAWSALRHLRGQSELCLGEPTHDARGLLMAIRF